jgi:thiol-disulfide isomerase/thioredoxin
MNELYYFKLKFCPYCIRVNGFLEELLKDERYKSIKIRTIDESKERELANSYDYYLVPTFFLNGKKLYEGIMTKEDLKKVLEEALKK